MTTDYRRDDGDWRLAFVVLAAAAVLTALPLLWAKWGSP